MSLCTVIFIGLATSAAAGGFMQTQDAEKHAEAMQQAVEANSEASAMKSALEAQLAHYMTEEGQKEHEKSIKDQNAKDLKDAAEEMEWLSDFAKDGVWTLNGVKFPVLDSKIQAGRLPKGLPEFPTDETERRHFMETLPVGPGTYSAMLSLKKNPSQMADVAKDEFKSGLEKIVQDNNVSPFDASLVQQTVEEKQQTAVEVIKASPKAFKKALKSWERIVPEAASVLLQTASDEGDQEAVHLAKRARHLHNEVYSAVNQVTNKATLMAVAQNRITSLLMRQAEKTIKDFDALEGCTDAKRDFEGAQARCLCVADNICHKMEHATSGNTCSIVSSSTCMADHATEPAGGSTGPTGGRR